MTTELNPGAESLEDRAGWAAEQFATVFGGAPQGVWNAPGRVNLIGEHTDYNDGLVMPFALEQSALVAARAIPERIIRVHSTHHQHTAEHDLEGLTPGAVSGWVAYPAGVAWALQQQGYGVGGVELLVTSTVPQGAGLSSSAAVECATAQALVDLHGHEIDPLGIAEIARRAENQFVGMPCGLMDQMVSMLGRSGHAVQFDIRSAEAQLVPLPADQLEILVVDTGAPHQLVDSEYAVRRQQCEAGAAALGVASLRDVTAEASELPQVLDQIDDPTLQRRVRHVLTENQRVLQASEALRSGDLAEVGKTLTASHESLRDDFEVTVMQTDQAQQALLTAGALGARMTGGGFGGCVIGLFLPGTAAAAAQEVAAACAASGGASVRTFIARPSDGASRVK